MYVDRGIDPELAAPIAEQVHEDPELAVAVHAREELGVDPDNLPSPLVAAGSSFVSFAIGAVLPAAAVPARRDLAAAGDGHQPARAVRRAARWCPG